MQIQNILNSVLEAYQDASNSKDINRILSSTISLITTLNNPSNITLVTSQLLIAPAIWSRLDGLETSFRIISLFNAAAIRVKNNERERKIARSTSPISTQLNGLESDDWSRAVLRGLDEKSFGWQHILVVAGIILGMDGKDRQGLSTLSRNHVQLTMVDAVNKSLRETASTGIVAAGSIVLALNHAFSLLSNSAQRRLNYDELLPVMIRAMTSTEGFQNGVFIKILDFDLRGTDGKGLHESNRSASLLQLLNLRSKPLIASMGPLSRLISHAIENASSPLRVVEARCNLLAFSSSIFEQWRKTWLSKIDLSEESRILTPEIRETIIPSLWHLLKTAMFATILILRAIIARTLIDPQLSSQQFASVTASQVLLILKNIHFISSREGSNSFSAYTFVKLSSIDILTHNPFSAVAFLRSIYPSSAGTIPSNPLDRNLELFYLNLVEHFTLCLGPANAEALIVQACIPYLAIKDASFSEMFEAAHSAMLCVFATPQNAELTAKFIPLYVERLFESFPRNLSPRQFIYAFKALIQICSPPNALSTSQPMMTEILLEVLYQRTLTASTTSLSEASAIKHREESPSQDNLSEQAVLVLALIDALPNLALRTLRTWLPSAATLLNMVPDKLMRKHSQKRFWDVLDGGDMDIERRAICVAWWTSNGGRESVLFGDKNPSHENNVRESRL